MELMQKGLLDLAQKEKTVNETKMKECETKHAKEIEELRKFYAGQAKVREGDCKKTTAKIPTTQEKQPENHHTMTKTPAIEEYEQENNKEETMKAKGHKVKLTRNNKKSV